MLRFFCITNPFSFISSLSLCFMKQMEQRRPFLTLLLAFSFLLSSLAAVPTSRILNSIVDNPSIHQSDAQDALMEEGLIEGRMDIEVFDYPGTGANHNHDPKTPGRA